MKKTILPFALVAAALSLLSCAPAPPTNTSANANANANASPAPTEAASKKAPTDLEQLAGRLVTQSAGVKEGDVVFVAGGSQDPELLEDIALHVRKAGALPPVSINSHPLAQPLYADVPRQY